MLWLLFSANFANFRRKHCRSSLKCYDPFF
jgi:hypothetical protein